MEVREGFPFFLSIVWMVVYYHPTVHGAFVSYEGTNSRDNGSGNAGCYGCAAIAYFSCIRRAIFRRLLYCFVHNHIANTETMERERRMRKMIWLLAAFLPLTAFLSVRAPKTRLSDYGFFSGDIRLQQPAAGVIPYSLNTPLFSDHAEKLRFVRVPEGQIVSYNDTATFDFPVGAALVKTFYFPVDARDAS